MCGICGIINLNGKAVERLRLERMNNLLYHRGPDDEGYYISRDKKAGLGMRRLSIIDLETGHQPIHNEDSTVWIVFNGEIYNYLELRKKLEMKHRFYTKTDTETIVHMYEEYGADCIKHLNGMFAFALWDERKNSLLLARDRLGQKPLYYTRINGSFYFASEIKSLIEAPGFEKNINLKAIHHYLTYQYIPSPMTIWEGVRKLKQANFIILNQSGKMDNRNYWSLDYSKKTQLSFEEAKRGIRDLLRDSTRLRMVSDVPLGAFLSGGHDSSIIVGLMSELSSRPVKTFSIGFEDQEFSELKYARIVAERFGTDHREFIIKPDYIDILPDIVWYYDQPYADSSALPSYYVARMTRRHVKVALNGDAGDENFAGYLRYEALKISQYLSLLYRLAPSKLIDILKKKVPMHESVNAGFKLRYLHRFLEPLGSSPAIRNVVWHAYFRNELKNFIYSDVMKKKMQNSNSYDFLEDIFLGAPADDTIDRALYTDFNAYLPDDLMVKMDIASMANSLETRSPFLDYRFVEFNAALPSKWKLKGINRKYILKETFRNYLPERIFRRGKQGFSIPVGSWFRTNLKNYLREVILSDRAIGRGYFKPSALKKIVEDHMESRKDYGRCLWALLMLELWHRKFIDSSYQI